MNFGFRIKIKSDIIASLYKRMDGFFLYLLLTDKFNETVPAFIFKCSLIGFSNNDIMVYFFVFF